MHTVALRTEATIQGGQMPLNIGQVFKVESQSILYHIPWFLIHVTLLIWMSKLKVVYSFFFLFYAESHEWDVCIPCNHYVKHTWNLYRCLYSNGFHGNPTQPLSSFWHNICFHRRVSYFLPFSLVDTCICKIEISLYLFAYCCWTCRKRVQQRLALYQGVCPVYMEFSDDSEETFTRALDFLQVTLEDL